MSIRFSECRVPITHIQPTLSNHTINNRYSRAPSSISSLSNSNITNTANSMTLVRSKLTHYDPTPVTQFAANHICRYPYHLLRPSKPSSADAFPVFPFTGVTLLVHLKSQASVPSSSPYPAEPDHSSSRSDLPPPQPVAAPSLSWMKMLKLALHSQPRQSQQPLLILGVPEPLF